MFGPHRLLSQFLQCVIAGLWHCHISSQGLAYNSCLGALEARVLHTSRVRRSHSSQTFAECSVKKGQSRFRSLLVEQTGRVSSLKSCGVSGPVYRHSLSQSWSFSCELRALIRGCYWLPPTPMDVHAFKIHSRTQFTFLKALKL